MANSSPKPRQKLIDAALELFVSQGVANTATRQIANLASVNEATLFRNFGNKYGLLQAVIQEAGLFESLETQIKSHLQSQSKDGPLTLKQYALAFLEAIASQDALLCSLIGEAENYTPEFKGSVAQTLAASNQRLSVLLQDVIPEGALADGTFTGLLHGLLLSYAVLRFTSQVSEPWSSPENYVDAVLRLLETKPEKTQAIVEDAIVQDLPRPIVQSLLQQAKKQGMRDYAVLYLLFGAGLRPEEICGLKQGDRMADAQQQVLTVRNEGRSRQVPVNQWILGKRYGSYTSNPLTRWLKGRKDESEFLLVTDAGLGMTPGDVVAIWQKACEAIGESFQIWQCGQTWQVEMLMRGITVENLSILSGVEVERLQPLAQRAREKAALEHAVELDKKM